MRRQPLHLLLNVLLLRRRAGSRRARRAHTGPPACSTSWVERRAATLGTVGTGDGSAAAVAVSLGVVHSRRSWSARSQRRCPSAWGSAWRRVRHCRFMVSSRRGCSRASSPGGYGLLARVERRRRSGYRDHANFSLVYRDRQNLSCVMRPLSAVSIGSNSGVAWRHATRSVPSTTGRWSSSPPSSSGLRLVSEMTPPLVYSHIVRACLLGSR